MFRRLGLILLLLLLSVTIVYGQDTPPDGSNYQLVEIVTGLERPDFLTHAGDGSGRLFVVSQNGQILIVREGKLLDQPFLDVSSIISRDASERGLLGLAF